VAEGRVTALLEATRLHLRHPRAERDSLRDVSLGVGRGEIVALVGPNGSGKSKLLAALGRVLRPRSGGVRLAGVDAWRIPRRRFARRVARLPQAPLCPEGLRVEELVQSGRNPHGRRFGPRTREDRDAVERALRALDLVDQRRRPVETLSGGERRRAWLAMVLAQETEILLLDEPTAALDLRHQWEVLDRLARANRERGVTVVMSLHDLEQAAAWAHRVAVVHRGRLYAVGPPERCLTEETLRDVFNVDARVAKEDGRLRIRVRGPGDPVRSL
jgi:iron complex transport system ATP-binding protein